MMELGTALAMAAAAGLGGTGLGGAAAYLLGGASRRGTGRMLAFAAGMMVAVVCFDLLPAAAAESLWRALGAFLGGCAAAMALEELCGRDRGTGWLTAAAIALHNVPEGMVIGAGDLRFGMTAAVLIGLHDLPEGMAVGAALLSGGARGLRAAAAAAAAGLPTVAGAGLGWLLGALSPGAQALAVGTASGAMLYVSFAQLLPQAVRLWSSRGAAAAAAAGVAVGLVVSA